MSHRRAAAASAAVLAAALTLAGVPACGGGGAKKSDTTAAPGITRATVDGQPVEVWPVRGSRAAVVLLHGYSGDERLREGRHESLVVRLHDAGWTVAASLAHGDAWGDDASVTAYERLIDLLRTDYGADRVALVGVSMGGLAALRLVERGRSDLMVGVSAVTDPRSITHPTLVASLRTRDAPATWQVDRLRDADITFVADPHDDIVPTPANTALAARIGARVRTCSGGHTSEECLLQAAEVLGRP